MSSFFLKFLKIYVVLSGYLLYNKIQGSVFDYLKAILKPYVLFSACEGIFMGELFKKHKIAVFVNGWSGDFLELILEGIRKGAQKYNVDIFVFTSYIFWGEAGPQSMCQLNIFHLPDPKDFDGAIVLNNTFNIPDERERILALFGKSGIPMITTEVPMPGMAMVGTDNYGGMHDLTEHLVNEHNVKKVVYIAGIQGNQECAVRKKAVEDTLAGYGLSIVDTIYGNFGYYQTSVMMQQWIEKNKELPDAFICANDLMAIGAISTLHKNGIEVPQDVLVTGFDNIRYARTFYPAIATVSRQWDLLGEQAFDTLADQIAHPDPEYSKIYESRFIPSESCGCTASEEDRDARLDTLRSNYANTNKNEMLEIFFQDMRVPMSKVENKEQFYKAAELSLGVHDFVGDDFCLCTEPLFFELDDESYPRRIRGYSKKMDLIYGRAEGKSLEQRTFDSKEIYPGYRYEPGKSNLYIIAPLNKMEFIIGYVVIRNDPAALYDLRLRKFVSDIDTLFITVRQYIFSQQMNRKLKEIYMTDFLTGLYNRTGCETVLYSFVEEEKRQGNDTMLLFIDINYMKYINDDYGHLSGDLAIQATARAMKNALPDNWLLGRYGGDEFIAVGRFGGEGFAEKIKAKFVDSMKKVTSRLKLSFMLSASAGYSIIRPDDDRMVVDFIREADESMYEEKEHAHREIEEHRRNK